MVTRIRQLLNWQQLSPTQFADLIGVGRPVVSHILSERNKPSLEVVQRIIAAFPVVSLPWLLTGAGEMLAEAVIGVTNSSTAANSTPESPAPAKKTYPLEPPRVAIPTQPIAQAPAPPVSALAPSAPAFRRTTAARPAPVRFVAGQTSLATTTPAPPAPPTPSTAPEQASAAPAPASPAAQAGTDFLATAAVAAPVAAAQFPVASVSAAPQVPDDTAAMAASLSEPGKAIRRIVIFYRDGSFADYQPEA